MQNDTLEIQNSDVVIPTLDEVLNEPVEVPTLDQETLEARKEQEERVARQLKVYEYNIALASRISSLLVGNYEMLCEHYIDAMADDLTCLASLVVSDADQATYDIMLLAANMLRNQQFGCVGEVLSMLGQSLVDYELAGLSERDEQFFKAANEVAARIAKANRVLSKHALDNATRLATRSHAITPESRNLLQEIARKPSHR